MENQSKCMFNCPSCGASIQQDTNRNSMYCSFCGQPIIDVRSIIEQQAQLEAHKAEMTAVREHKAELQEMDIDHERRMANAQAANKFIGSFGGCFGTVLGRVLGAVVGIIVTIMLAPYLLDLIWKAIEKAFKLK